MSHTIPGAWLCPITYSVMRDPVIAPDGRTYERAAICQWLSIHGTSPFTREAMCEEDLIPNMAIRELIEEAMSPPPIDVVSFVPNKAMSERPLITLHKIIYKNTTNKKSTKLKHMVRIETPNEAIHDIPITTDFKEEYKRITSSLILKK